MTNGKNSSNNRNNSVRIRTNRVRTKRGSRLTKRLSTAVGGAKRGGISSATRTPSSIISNISKSFTAVKTVISDPYINARLDPFTHAAGAIPDGQNQNYICLDLHSADTLTNLPNSFVIQTMPCLPSMGLVGSTAGSMTVNGVVHAALTQYRPNASNTTTTNWAQICIPNVLNGYYTGLGVQKNDPWNATKARVGVMGYRIIYTGPVSTCAGSITVTPNQVGFTSFGIVSSTTSSATTWTVTSTLPAGTAGTDTVALNTPLIAIEMDINPTNLTKESKTYRPEESILILPRYLAKSNLPKDIYQGTYPLIANANGATANVTYFNLGSKTPASSGGVVWIDDDWESYQIAFNGINSDASYRIETVMCFEANLQQNSAFTAVAKEKAPHNNTVMYVSEMMNNIVPPVMSARQHQDTTSQVAAKIATGSVFRKGRTGPARSSYI